MFHLGTNKKIITIKQHKTVEIITESNTEITIIDKIIKIEETTKLIEAELS